MILSRLSLLSVAVDVRRLFESTDTGLTARYMLSLSVDSQGSSTAKAPSGRSVAVFICKLA